MKKFRSTQQVIEEFLPHTTIIKPHYSQISPSLNTTIIHCHLHPSLPDKSRASASHFLSSLEILEAQLVSQVAELGRTCVWRFKAAARPRGPLFFFCGRA